MKSEKLKKTDLIFFQKEVYFHLTWHFDSFFDHFFWSLNRKHDLLTVTFSQTRNPIVSWVMHCLLEWPFFSTFLELCWRWAPLTWSPGCLNFSIVSSFTWLLAAFLSPLWLRILHKEGVSIWSLRLNLTRHSVEFVFVLQIYTGFLNIICY